MQEPSEPRKGRGGGFADMDPERRQQLARVGGRLGGKMSGKRRRMLRALRRSREVAEPSVAVRADVLAVIESLQWRMVLPRSKTYVRRPHAFDAAGSSSCGLYVEIPDADLEDADLVRPRCGRCEHVVDVMRGRHV